MLKQYLNNKFLFFIRVIKANPFLIKIENTPLHYRLKEQYSVTYRWRVEEQHVASSDDHESRAITLPWVVIIQNPFVYPAHVLDFFVYAEIQVV